MSDESVAEMSDESLAARVALRDLTAFGALYDRYSHVVFTLAAHMLGRQDAEETVQEVFLRVWDRSRQFDPARGALKTWLMAIARHHIIDELRKRGQRQRITAAETVDALLAVADPSEVDMDEQAWLKQAGDAALSAIRGLPAEQRKVLVLAYFAGLTQSEIAAHIGCPLGTVKKRIRLGLQKLRVSLAKEGLMPMEPEPTKGA